MRTDISNYRHHCLRGFLPRRIAFNLEHALKPANPVLGSFSDPKSTDYSRRHVNAHRQQIPDISTLLVHAGRERGLHHTLPFLKT
jgi:hypothetical protein